MTAVTRMREEIKKHIDTADAKMVKMIHAILEVEREGNWWQEEEVLAIIEERSADYKSGKIPGIPWETAKKQFISAPINRGPQMNNEIKHTSIEELSEEILRGLKIALRKLVEKRAAENGTLVIGDKDGTIRTVPAKDLLETLE